MKRCPVCKTPYPVDANFCPLDASALVDDPTAVPRSLDLPTMQARLVGGRFRLGPQIGGKRTGEVFSAEDITTSAPAAVKLVSPAVFPTPLVAQRTERELKQLTKVTSDRVARVLDVGKQGDRLFVALELLNGVTLADYLAATGPLPVDQAVRLALEIGEGLAEAAKLGVIHRDVSPKNVMLVTDDRAPGGRRVKIINFGIPTPVSDKVLGIPEYLSPEQAEGKPVDQRSNIYSLGTLLYTLLAGGPPFTGDVARVIAQHSSQSPTPPSQRAMGVPPEVERMILKALEKSSSRRHLTLRQLLGEMEAALAHLPPTAPMPLPTGSQAAPRPVPVPRVSSQHSVPSRPSAGHAVQPAPHSNRRESSNKTMVGIGLKDILPHLVPPSEGGTGPTVKQPALIVPEPAPPQLPENHHPASSRGPAAMAQTQPQSQPPSVSPATASTPAQPHPAASAQPPPVLFKHPYQSTGAEPPPEPPAVTFNKQPPRARPAERPPEQSAAGKSGRKGKFRETMWFKKGELDEQVAQDTEGQSDAHVAVDTLPIEDRYKDDGTITAADRERLSLRTGGTQMSMQAAPVKGAVPGPRITEKDMLDELSGGRRRFIFIGAGVAAVVLVLILILVLR